MKKLTLVVGMMAMAATMAMAGPGGMGMGMGMGQGCGATDATGAACAGPGGMGMGMGMGVGQGCGATDATGAACAGPGGNGPGRGYGRGGFKGGGGPAMALLTPEEQAQHRTAMHSFKTTEECTAYIAQHRQLVEARAKEKGVAAPLGPRGNACERMKMRGMIVG